MLDKLVCADCLQKSATSNLRALLAQPTASPQKLGKCALMTSKCLLARPLPHSAHSLANRMPRTGLQGRMGQELLRGVQGGFILRRKEKAGLFRK